MRGDVKNKNHKVDVDTFTAHLFDVAGLAIGRWLEERGYLHKPISTLERHELAGMAWAAIAAYQDLREQKRLELCQQESPPGNPLTPDPLDKLLIP